MTQSPKNVVLSIRGLRKEYGKIRALDGVDIAVERGDIYGFLGRNGAGKSTTIKIIAGLVRSDQGEIEVLGRRVEGPSPALRSRLGFLIENPVFHGGMTALENLRCHLLLTGRTQEGQDRGLMESLDRVGLASVASRRVRGFSTGMRQRLGLAQALLGNPDLVVLDEPLNGLDPEGIVQVRRLIRERARSRGTVFFISSHILAEVEQLCNRVGIVARGRTVAEGRLEDLGVTGWVDFRVSDPGKALKALKDRWPDAEDKEKGRDGFSLRMDAGRVPEAVRIIVGLGIDLHGVGTEPRSLEDLFMHLTEGTP